MERTSAAAEVPAEALERVGDLVDVASLARRIRAGEAGAFALLYERYAPMVHGILIARVSAGEAEDLTQEVFVAAWRGLDGLRRDEHVGAWIAGIARNLARRGRERRPRPLEPLSDEHPVEARAGSDGVAILEVLRALPPAYAETLSMRLVEGLSGPEIAAATGLTEGSVRVNLCRGMKLLRERLEREGLA